MPIDLSKFKAPPAVAGVPSFEATRGAWLADYALRRLDYDAADIESDPAVKLCETGAEREIIIIQAANDGGSQCMLPWANGANLDPLAANLGVERLDAESDDRLRLRAAGSLPGSSVAGPEAAYVRLALAATPLASSVAARRTAPGAIRVTALVDGASESPALDMLPEAPGEIARALLELGAAPDLYDKGVSGRVAAGSMAVDGLEIEEVEWDTATDELCLRGPAGLQAWAAAGGAGNGKAVFLHDGQLGIALQVSQAAWAAPDCLKWNALDAKGKTFLDGLAAGDEILFIAADPNAAAPAVPGVDIAHAAREARMLFAIRAELNRRDVRPMGDIVTVAAATLAAWNLTATIGVESGADAAIVLDAAIAAVEAYGASVRQVGGAVKLGGLYAALYRPGVNDAAIAAPAADIAAATDTAPDLGTVQVTIQ